jgi:hypothetical protein
VSQQIVRATGAELRKKNQDENNNNHKSSNLMDLYGIPFFSISLRAAT